MTRPEHILPAEMFYNTEEAKKYATNTRMIQAQYEMTERALQILAIPEDKQALILDIGCGSGLSGDVLTDNGYLWIGVDISRSMLEVARENESQGDLLHKDIGQGLCFRPGTFDYAVSISVIQWLCNAEKSSHNPIRRLKTFFSSLYNCLIMGARCAFQFYPDNPEQVDMITKAALDSGFTGGLVIDYPNSTKAKKYYLFLQAGFTKDTINEVTTTIPQPLDDDIKVKDDSHISYHTKKANEFRKNKNNKNAFKSREWVLEKKESERLKGKDVRQDTKYSGRRRPLKGI